MQIQESVPLAPYTSFGVGGKAQHFSLVRNSIDLEEALRCTLPDTRLWILGYGSNCLISDDGLEGMTICVQGGTIEVNNDQIIADAGVWWDDVVQTAIDNKLWGIELLSEVPGSVGGSTYINITAYGQSLGSRIEWVDVWDRLSSQVKRLYAQDLSWSYKSSVFQSESGANWIILRICLKLSRTRIDELTYQKALDVAVELSLNENDLSQRRQIIIEARKRAGSLWHPNSNSSKTVGSFFRNPLVSPDIADKIIQFDETGKTAEQIKNMNSVHGGSEQRVSAAHVMLAAGFRRGQSWGNVKLNDSNLLKIEALDGATAQDIFNVVQTIVDTVRDKLGITLVAEARILGDFI